MPEPRHSDEPHGTESLLTSTYFTQAGPDRLPLADVKFPILKRTFTILH